MGSGQAWWSDREKELLREREARWHAFLLEHGFSPDAVADKARTIPEVADLLRMFQAAERVKEELMSRDRTA